MASKHKPKPKPHKSVVERARSDRAFLKKALADPGLRSKLPSSMLPADLRQRREMNVRLNTPVTPGSSMTERDLANAAQAATGVRYGPQETELGQQLGLAQQTQRDTGSFYDQYLADLRQHAANVQAFQQGAQQALQQTAQGFTGLSGAEGAALQAQANQTAVPGVAPAGNLAPEASDATAVRQALFGGFQADQGMLGAAANTYASSQANVVGPGQKLGALAQAAGRTKDVRKQIANLKAEEGAFNQQFRDTRRQDEFRNVLAQQTLGANVAQNEAQQQIDQQKIALAQQVAGANAAAKSPEAKGAAAAATSEAQNAAKYGYTVHQWRLLGPNGRAKVIAKSKKTATRPGSDVITSGPLAGKTKKWVAAHPTEAGQLVSAYEKRHAGGKKPKPGEPGGGPDWQTNAQQGQGASDAANLKDLANRARAGKPFVAGHAPQPRMNRHQAARKIQQSANIRDPILLTAALDAVYDGHLSRETVRRLIAAGYKPSRIASALGVPTAGDPAYQRRQLAGAAQRPGVQPLSPNPPRR